MIAPVRSLAPLALSALAMVACGGPPTSTASANSASSDQASIARTVNEPRTEDPTAAASTTLAPTRGGNAPAAGKAPSSKPAKAPQAPTTNEDASASKTAAGAAEEAPPRQIGARHVLVQWMGADRAGKSVLRTRDQALVLIQEVQRRAKAGEDLGRLAVEYSDEPNAGDRRGSLGRFGRGQMVPAFDAAVFKLKVGEISDIVETPFGFHIIQRTE